MTYRNRARGRSERRRAHKAKLFEQAVAKEVAKKPPRVEVRREPARPPRTRELSGLAGGPPMDLYELGEAPKHRIVQVPILPADWPRFSMLSPLDRGFPEHSPNMRHLRFQAQAWECKAEGTIVRWWTWESLDGRYKPQKWNALHRTRAHAEQARRTMTEVIGACESPPEYLAQPRWGLGELATWLKMLIEDLEEALGEP